MATSADTSPAGIATLPPAPPNAPAAARTVRPDVEPDETSRTGQILVGTFVGVPMLALLAAAPLAWGWGLGLHDIVIAVVFYAISGLGISMGYHRYFTNGSFKSKRGFKIALALAGSLALDDLEEAIASAESSSTASLSER